MEAGMRDRGIFGAGDYGFLARSVVQIIVIVCGVHIWVSWPVSGVIGGGAAALLLVDRVLRGRW